MIEFQTESQTILGELLSVVDDLENAEDFDPKLFAEFAQKIDRIMGGAETLALLDPEHTGLKFMAETARLCKQIGYKVSESKNPALVPIVAGFWADVVEVLQTLVRNLEDIPACQRITEGFSGTLKSRLEWIAKQLR